MSNNTILQYLIEGEADTFLKKASELDSGTWKSEENIKLLINSICLDNLGIRDYVYRIVLTFDDEGKSLAALQLCQYLYAAELEVRNFAADLLIKLGTVSNPYLIKLLNDDNIDVKKFASDILGLTGTDSELPHLVILLNDDDLNVVSSAIEAIGNIFERYEKEIPLGDSMSEMLFNYYKFNKPDIKPILILTLSKISSSKSSDYLMKILEDEDDIFIRSTIIDGLALCGSSEEVYNYLLKELPNLQPELQVVALKALVAVSIRIGMDIIVDDSIKQAAYIALFDNDGDIQTAGIIALGDVFHIEDLEPIARVYSQGDEHIRQYILSVMIESRNIHLMSEFLNILFPNLISGNNYPMALEFAGIVRELAGELHEDSKEQIIKICIVGFSGYVDNDEYETFEIFRTISPNLFDDVLSSLISSNLQENTKYLILQKYFETLV
ncbi:MAG: HEAT repeat domain-containing protein [Candidatus Kapaibacterium sp.]|jgi:HEAT repeat protein|nr:HEAT repeat domain-containing protein [Candidatus Kapabacteria bacterium]